MDRILHVEDESDIREVARLALEAVGGFEVESAESGLEGLKKAKASLPDLILLDVMMPGMDGPSTLRALQNCPDVCGIPVIFMTAKVQTNEVDRYRAMGALDVISKPFDPMTLADQIREIWARERSRRSLT